MSQISKVIFGALAASLTLGAVPFAVGQDRSSGQEFAGRFEAVAEPGGTGVNRSTKADRAADIPAAGAPTRTISMKVESLTDTSILVRVPVAKEARNLPPAPVATKPGATQAEPQDGGGLRADGQRADRSGKTAAAGALRDLSSPPRMNS